MAEPGRDAEERTEAATPRRRQKAREEGHVAISRELPSFAVLAAAALVLVLVVPASLSAFAAVLAGLLGHAHELGAPAALRAVLAAGLAAAAPFALAALVAGAAAVLAQTGFLVHVEALSPDLSRLSPRAGFKRLFGGAMWLNTGKAVLKALAAALALFFVLKGAFPELRAAMFWTAPGLVAHFAALLTVMLLAVLAVQGAFALGDFGWTWFKYIRDLRMSRQDIREEMRESEGDPLLKARLRQLRQRRLRQRLAATVPKATVVVTNPTHYAVALAYDRSAAGAPRVVAKGVDEVAARIRALAEQHKVPMVANPPLARALYRVELDSEIPVELFQAVAEIIAYVLRLANRAGRARG